MYLTKRWILAGWIWAAGCPWISPAEHADNVAKQDADADVDADTDTDSPHTGHSQTGCVEDPDEDNDTIDEATVLALPAALGASSCGGDPDWWEVELDGQSALDVITARLQCTGDVVLRIWKDGKLGVTTASACGTTTRLGLGRGTYSVQVSPVGAGDLGEYDLTLDTENCGLDGDGDGQPSSSCPGGGDCDDTDRETYRFAVDDPALPADEDCDGTNDLAPRGTCNANINDPVVGLPQLACGQPDVDPVWHHLTFDVDALNVDIYLTPVGGEGDLIAWFADDSGSYGLDQGESELDSEDVCDPPAYGSCPSSCLGPAVGTGHLWIAQRGCTGPVSYELRLRVGPDSPPALLSQEFDVGPPPPLAP